MSANPAISEIDFNALPTIDIAQLEAILGGEGWGQWVGKYAGAAAGGAAGVFLGTPGGPIAQGATGALGASLGYDYGGQFGNWLTGGR